MEGFVGEVRLFAGNFAPANWMLCQGQLLAINRYTAVFSILGVAYGGDGRTNFALPNFSGRMAVGIGQGAGIPQYLVGETNGSEGYVLAANNMPAHTHGITGTVTISGTAADGNADTPEGKYPASLAGNDMYATATNGSFMANMQHNLSTAPVGATGSPSSVNNIQPMLGMTFVICIAGVFPQRP